MGFAAQMAAKPAHSQIFLKKSFIALVETVAALIDGITNFLHLAGGGVDNSTNNLVARHENQLSASFRATVDDPLGGITLGALPEAANDLALVGVDEIGFEAPAGVEKVEHLIGLLARNTDVVAEETPAVPVAAGAEVLPLKPVGDLVEESLDGKGNGAGTHAVLHESAGKHKLLRVEAALAENPVVKVAISKSPSLAQQLIHDDTGRGGKGYAIGGAGEHESLPVLRV